MRKILLPTLVLSVVVAVFALVRTIPIANADDFLHDVKDGMTHSLSAIAAKQRSDPSMR
jgi:hypothetical protein